MLFILNSMYGMTEELVICETRIEEVAGRVDPNSRMTSFKVTMPLILQTSMRVLL